MAKNIQEGNLGERKGERVVAPLSSTGLPMAQEAWEKNHIC